MDSSLEAPQTVKLEGPKRSEIQNGAIVGTIGGNDTVDVYRIQGQFSGEGIATIGLIAESEALVYDLAVLDGAGKRLAAYENTSGNKLFSFSPSGEFKVELTNARSTATVSYALALSYASDRSVSAPARLVNIRSSIPSSAYERSPLREGLRDVAAALRGAKRIAFRHDPLQDSRARFALLEGLLDRQDEGDAYFLSRNFPPNTHLSFWFASPGALVSMVDARTENLLTDELIVGGELRVDVVATGRIYLVFKRGPTASAVVPYSAKIWEYPGDAGQRGDAGPDWKSAAPFPLIKVNREEGLRSAILRGRIGGDDGIDSFRWKPHGASHLIAAAQSSPPDSLDSIEIVNAETGEVLAEQRLGKKEFKPAKAYIETYADGPVLLRLSSRGLGRAAPYALSLLETPLPALPQITSTAPENYSFFAADESFADSAR